MTAPEMYAASSDAIQATTPATSSAVAKRPAGMLRLYSACVSSGRAAVMSVSMKPGATTFAVMPRAPSSRVIDRAMPTSPAFDAA